MCRAIETRESTEEKRYAKNYSFSVQLLFKLNKNEKKRVHEHSYNKEQNNTKGKYRKNNNVKLCTSRRCCCA